MHDKRLRQAALWLGSVLGHLALFAAIGLSTPQAPTPKSDGQPPVDVIFLTPPTRKTAKPSSGGQPAAPRPARLSPPPAVAPSPLPAATPGDAGTGGRGAASGANSPADYPQAEDRMRKILRASPTACNARGVIKLTQAERDACDERMGRPGKGDDIDAPMDAAKRKRFDQTSAKQRRDREWRENPTIPTGTSGGGDGRPSGLGEATPTTIGQ
jgi:hypothetical protein